MTQIQPSGLIGYKYVHNFPSPTSDFNKEDFVAGFIHAEHKNEKGNDVTYFREVLNDDRRVFDQTDMAISMYKQIYFKDSTVFKTNYAAVITYNPVFENHYQIIYTTDDFETFVVMNLGETTFSSYHGVSYPKCSVPMLKRIDVPRTSKFNLRSNVNVTGRFVYPITNRECDGKSFNVIAWLCFLARYYRIMFKPFSSKHLVGWRR